MTTARSLMLTALALAGMMACAVIPTRAKDAAPSRVVSMNLCTDQLAMLIAAPGQLHSVSNLAADPTASVLHERAGAYKHNHGLAEEIFLLKPDLVLAGKYSTRETVAMLRQLGFRVEEFSPEQSFEEIRSNITRMGRLLHRQERARDLIAQLDARLAEVPLHPHGKTPLAALYYSNSYTSGLGTFADEIVRRAGLRNLAGELDIKGLSVLPLELLIKATPDVVVTGSDWPQAPALAQETFEHPALSGLSAYRDKTTIDEKYWICGGPFTVDAVHQLAAARRDAVPHLDTAFAPLPSPSASVGSIQPASPTPLHSLAPPALTRE